jgi:hypothetical protein
MILDSGKRYTALLLGGSVTEIPGYFMIGSGSGATYATDTTLVYAFDRQEKTAVSTTDVYKVKWTGDWTSVEMSGTSLREFGLCLSGTGTTGSMLSKVGLPALAFDGTQELRIEETWRIY